MAALIRNIKSIAVLLALALVAGGFLYASGLRERSVRLASELDLQRREAESLRLELRLQHQALAEREREKARLAEEKNALAEELEHYYENDGQARAWADTPCPDGVLERLRR